MDGFFAVMATFTVLGATVTKVTDFIRNVFDKGDTWPKWSWNVVPLVAGVAMCVGWQIDQSSSLIALVPALARNADRLQGVAGQVLTGLLLGGFAGFLHELFDALSGIATRAHAAAGP
jgi:hypothetical protein